MNARLMTAFPLLASVLAGCVDHAPIPARDAGVDTATELPDAGVDAPADVGVDAPVDPPCNGPPGLYVTGSCTQVSPGVELFIPKYTLWTDAAVKERFIYLPPGTQIDTSDPNAWIFPRGTKLWKTFSLGGRRLETRLLEKVGTGVGMASWSIRGFLWNAAQNAVTEQTEGAVDVLGTNHDVPATSLCVRCHAGASADVSLGISAISLMNDESPFNLRRLNDEAKLTHPIALTDAVVPGTPTERAALGYMHINCGPCHGGPSPQAGMRLWVDVGLERVDDTGAYLTAVGVNSSWSTTGATVRIAPGAPDASTVIRRMSTRASATDQMPPLGTEVVDAAGAGIVRTWISTLAP